VVQKNVHIPIKLARLHIETDEFSTVYFERPIGFVFEAGDWIDIDFADTSYQGGKVYSLSSSPTENELAISFRNGISPFKRQLQAVQAGETMFISQYGNDYGFQLNEKRSSILVAGGIGIAPFRSMLKEIYDKGVNSQVRLVYLNKTDDFLFRAALDKWQQSISQLTINYVVTQNLKRKAREQQLNALFSDEADRYYIAGPEAMVENTEHQLLDMGVKIKDIRIDSFGTY
jgi:ferredoxin-NADP reductase